MPKYILWSLTTREPALDAKGRHIFADRPIHVDSWLPTWPGVLDRKRNAWAFAEIEETITDPKHTGKPKFEQRDWNVARVTRVIAPPKA
jgi:hypothetical protein